MNTKKRWAAHSLWFVCTALFLVGCLTPKWYVTSSILTSTEMFAKGKRTPVHSFGPQDFIVLFTDLKWDAVKREGGLHTVGYNWYLGNKLVSKSSGLVDFTSTPFTLATRLSAAGLGTGHFRVETVIDRKVVSTNDFEISP